MATKRQKQPKRFLKEVILVICEGNTESAYIDFLRKSYHSPIRIISQVEGQKISQKLIDKHEESLKIDKCDKVTTFLMYDMDVEAVNQRINQCKATFLLSNPCFEFWLLLHHSKVTTPLDTDAVIRKLKASDSVWQQYTKGTLTFSQQNYLWQNKDKAISHAKDLSLYSHPSSSVYLLLERLEKTIK
jgi:hypothetical protein